MDRRRRLGHRLVGMAMLLMATTSWGIFADDGPSSKVKNPATPVASQDDSSSKDQIKVLKQQIQQIQRILAEQNRLLEQLTKSAEAKEQPGQKDTAAPKAQSAQAVTATPEISQTHSAPLGDVASTTPIIPQQKKSESAVAPAGEPSMWIGPSGKGDDSSPLQIHIGDATITPVAFMDFTSVYRDHSTNGSIGTNFGSIPYPSGTSYQPNLSEFRLSSENSRLGLRVDAAVHGAHVMGYMEADFHGYNVTNASIVTNSNTLRERVYWVDLNTGKFEILGGQTWSLITPGRVGISPIPGDIFYSQDIDLNYQLGLVFGRIPELRFVYHPSKKAAFALAIDSPEQYGGGYGGAGSIVLPSALNTASTYQGEIDMGSGNTLNTPTLAPDIIAKLAFDPSKHVHFEIGGVERNFKVYDGATATHYTSVGGAGFVNGNFEVLKGFRLVINSYWGDGGGRYIYGQAPDLIAHADGSLSMIHSGSTVDGFEFTHKKTQLYAYYGGVYIMRNTAIDANGTSLIGYGYQGSSNAQNRALQEATIGFTQTIWKNPKFGALQFMGQYSYLTRDPWYVATGAPSNASINMVFFNLRYALPGSAPTMGK